MASTQAQAPYERLARFRAAAALAFPEATKVVAVWAPSNEPNDVGAEVWHGPRARYYHEESLARVTA